MQIKEIYKSLFQYNFAALSQTKQLSSEKEINSILWDSRFKKYISLDLEKVFW